MHFFISSMTFAYLSKSEKASCELSDNAVASLLSCIQ